MSKLPPDLEHPLDNFLVAAAEASLPLWRALRMVPNHVTALSIACEIAALWNLYRGRAVPFAVWAAAGVFFDYADGHYARTDDMVTRLGDLLDHVSDWTYAAAVVALVAWRLGPRRALVPLGIIAILGAAMAVHLGCQQRYYSEKPLDPAETLDSLRCLCAAGHPRTMLRKTRWLGSVAVFHAALIAAGVASLRK